MHENRPQSDKPGDFEIHAAAAALIYALMRNGYLEEATEFQEWYLDTFDYDLET